MARKPIFALLIRAAAFLFCFFLIQGFSNTKPYDYIEHRMLDYRFCIRDGLTSSRDNSEIIPSDIVIVGIDESTRKDPAFKDYMAFWLDRFSKAIEAIEDQGATVITFDILHDAEYPAIYKDQNGSKGSMPIWEVGKEMLRNVLVESQVTVIPYSYVIGQPDEEGLPIYQKEIDTETAETKNIGTQKTPLPDQDHYTFKDLRFPTYMYPYYRHLEPQDSFDRKFTRMTIDENLLRRYGFINSNLDIDGVKRHAALIQNYGHFVAGAEGEDPDKENFYSIALTTYLMARNIPVSKVEPGFDESGTMISLDIANKEIPLDNGELIINYSGPPGTYTTIPFADLFDEDKNITGGGEPSVIITMGKETGDYKTEDFKWGDFTSKIVIIGGLSPALRDMHRTPFNAVNPDVLMAGPEVIANIIDTIIHEKFITRSAHIVNIIALLLAAVLAMYLSSKRFAVGIIYLCATLLIFTVLNYALFAAWRYWMEITAIWIILVFTYLVGYVCNACVLETGKRKYQKFFSKYLDASIVDRYVDRWEDSVVKGQEREISVLFSDIRGFTTFSEKLKPEEIVRILNYHFTIMNEIVYENEGIVVSYAGDCIMAMWNSPTEVEDHRYKACRCALKMQASMDKVNEEIRNRGIELVDDLKVGVGINTGMAVVGNIGSEKRADYTAIGDTINVSARLESMNKELGTEVIITKAVLDSIEEKLVVKHLGKHKLRGKDDEVDIYNLIGLTQ